MPYVETSLLEKLNDEDKIWRYIDFTKFVSMLETNSLFFVRADKLLDLDPYEGFFHEMKFHEEYKKYGKMYDALKESARTEHPKFVFVNCWHINPNESDAMWKIYSKDDKGIAIQSTIKKLKESFEATSDELQIGKVRYVDHNKEQLIYENVFERFRTKPIAYSHEQELRLFAFETENNQTNGLAIDSKLEILIENLYLSPTSSSWFLDLVNNIFKKYGFDNSIISKSKLYDNPNSN